MLVKWIMGSWEVSYRDTVSVLLSNSLGFSLALLEGMLVLELGAHGGYLLRELYLGVRSSCVVDGSCTSGRRYGLMDKERCGGYKLGGR